MDVDIVCLHGIEYQYWWPGRKSFYACRRCLKEKIAKATALNFGLIFEGVPAKHEKYEYKFCGVEIHARTIR